jgi:crossover junction endodeoxyribonuclease RuvC
MKVMGIDPGTQVTGYAILQRQNRGLVPLDYGCVRPPAKALVSKKRHIIYEAISHLLDLHQPEALAVESPFLGYNFRSALGLGMVYGIAILAATARGISVFAYAPSQAKKAVTGRGRGSKHQVQGMVQRLLNLSAPPEPQDASDAIALAICHIQAVLSGSAIGKEV